MSFYLIDATHTVAMSHEDGCGCAACRATRGDNDAMDRIIAQYGAVLAGVNAPKEQR